MAENWKQTASLVFDTVSDAVQVVMLIMLPTPASSANGNDKMRALHLSALLALTVLGILLMSATRAAGGRSSFDALAFMLVSIAFFTIMSWIVFALLRLTGLYDPKGQTIIDALTLVIGFNLVAAFVAAGIKEADFLYQFNVTDGQLQSLTMWSSVFAAVFLALSAY